MRRTYEFFRKDEVRPMIQGSLKFKDIECISKIQSLREYMEFMKRVFITENKNMDRDQYCIQCSYRDFLKDYKCGHFLFFTKKDFQRKSSQYRI